MNLPHSNKVPCNVCGTALLIEELVYDVGVFASLVWQGNPPEPVGENVEYYCSEHEPYEYRSD